MESDTYKFSSNISILHDEIIKNATIIDDGIQENFSLCTNTPVKNAPLYNNNNASFVDEKVKGIFQDPTTLLLSHSNIIQNATIMDEGIQDTSSTLLTHAEIIKNATIIDEGIKLCPLCRNEVRLFFINFNEKVLMCENFDCDYPFGHDEVIYVKENANIQSDEEVMSIRSKPTNWSPTATGSVISAAAWSDIDKINKINDSEGNNDPRSETREYYKHKKSTKKGKFERIDENPKILKQVEAINKLHIELDAADDRCIKNEKWIKNLMNMQQSSGMSLLKPEEINMFKQKKPELGLGELKIDINPGSQENMSLIKIEIANADFGSNTGA